MAGAFGDALLDFAGGQLERRLQVGHEEMGERVPLRLGRSEGRRELCAIPGEPLPGRGRSARRTMHDAERKAAVPEVLVEPLQEIVSLLLQAQRAFQILTIEQHCHIVARRTASILLVLRVRIRLACVSF